MQHRAQLGGSQILFQSLQSGEIDAYCDYTGTIAEELLNGDEGRDEESMRAALANLNIGMSEPLGFNNSYAIGVTRAAAERFHLRTISDLARPECATLRFGFSDEFMSRQDDGWPTMKRVYQLPQSARGLEHTLAYQGIDSGQLDVIDLYTTDPEIEAYDLVTLVDDRGYFPNYNCVILYRLDLATRAPALLAAYQELVAAIDDATMRRMNARVRLDRESEKRVAADFLDEHLGRYVEVVDTTWQRRLARNTWEHLKLVSISMLAAILLAVPLGIVASRRESIGQGLLAVVGILQTIPSLAMLTFMVPLFGLGVVPAVVALFLYSLLPIVRNTYTGLRDIPPDLIESATVLGLPPRARLWKIELPLAAPTILAGIKTAAVINVGTATIGAFIGTQGYGQPIMTGLRTNRHDLILQGAIPAAIMAIGFQLIFEWLEKRLVPGSGAR